MICGARHAQPAACEARQSARRSARHAVRDQWLRKRRHGLAVGPNGRNAYDALDSLRTIRMENGGYHQPSGGNPSYYLKCIMLFAPMSQRRPPLMLCHWSVLPAGRESVSVCGRIAAQKVRYSSTTGAMMIEGPEDSLRGLFICGSGRVTRSGAAVETAGRDRPLREMDRIRGIVGIGAVISGGG